MAGIEGSHTSLFLQRGETSAKASSVRPFRKIANAAFLHFAHYAEPRVRFAGAKPGVRTIISNHEKSRANARLFSWLGRQDSNLRMLVPKTSALPLGDAPIALLVYHIVVFRHQPFLG
jgi:hypothetical protein